MTEYCERYAKKENISKTLPEESDEEISDEDISDETSTSSEENVAGEADPWSTVIQIKHWELTMCFYVHCIDSL